MASLGGSRPCRTKLSSSALIEVHRLAAELGGKMLVRTGGRSPSLAAAFARHAALDDLEAASSVADSQPPSLLPTAVPPSPPIVTAEAEERRQLTVLFGDLVHLHRSSYAIGIPVVYLGDETTTFYPTLDQ
jgi:hypothetical protein